MRRKRCIPKGIGCGRKHAKKADENDEDRCNGPVAAEGGGANWIQIPVRYAP
jgi:hypothetical protein